MQDAIDQLKSDIDKKVFWVNVYNSYFQLIASENKAELRPGQKGFFKLKQLSLLGLKLSFDDIEHVILRRSKWKMSFGYLNKFFPKKWEKTLRVAALDYRIHFVLNCGAISCPMILQLDVQNLEKKLEEATQTYLEQEVTVADNKIILNQLFLFYIGDFNGRRGLKRVLIKYNIIQETHLKHKFKFTEFDKRAKLNNFIEN